MPPLASLSRRPSIAVSVGLAALLLPLSGASQEQHDKSPSTTVLFAQETLRALHPELTGKGYFMSITTFGSFDVPWTSIPPFDVDIGRTETGYMEMIQTVPGRAWFVGFRFYAPTEAYFDKSWPLPDVEKVK